MRVIFGEKDEGECLGEKRFEAALLALLRDALASPLRLKHLACSLRFIYTVSDTSAMTRRANPARARPARAYPSMPRPREYIGFSPSPAGPVDAA